MAKKKTKKKGKLTKVRVAVKAHNRRVVKRTKR